MLECPPGLRVRTVQRQPRGQDPEDTIVRFGHQGGFHAPERLLEQPRRGQPVDLLDIDPGPGPRSVRSLNDQPERGRQQGDRGHGQPQHHGSRTTGLPAGDVRLGWRSCHERRPSVRPLPGAPGPRPSDAPAVARGVSEAGRPSGPERSGSWMT